MGSSHPDFARIEAKQEEPSAVFQLELFSMPPQLTAPSRPIVSLHPSNGRAALTPRKTVAEFFAGIGLVRLALEAEGWTIRFANDIDKDKLSIYSRNFPPDDFHLKDIGTVHTDEIPHVLLATASFPCTDLSLAGERRGLKGEHSGTLWKFLEIVRLSNGNRPKFLLLENVAGFLSSHNGKDFRATISKLNELGFDCDAFLVNAVHFVPQSRPRLFIFAVDKNVELPYTTVTAASSLQWHEARPEQLLRAIKANEDLSWRLMCRLPSLPEPQSNLHQILERVPEESSLWWDFQRKRHLLSQLSPRHKAVLQHLQARRTVGVATAYRRMRAGRIRAEIRCDGVAGCLRTPRGGSSRQILLFAGKGTVQVRHMTPREYARLQGVPDTFIIGDEVNKALFGFGDAVCVPAVRWLVRHVITPAATSNPFSPRKARGDHGR